MKSYSLFLSMFLSFTIHVHAQTFSDQIKKDITFEGNTVVVKNIHGEVQVESHEGSKVLLEVNRSFNASNAKLLETAKQELDIKSLINGDTLFIELNPPCDKTNITWRKGWNGNSIWWNACEWNPEYEFRLDFKLKVPITTNLLLSTIDEGDVLVQKVQGDIEVSNIHGGIRLDQIAGAVDANTIHGDIEVNYAQSPTKNAYFHAHHGDIEMNLPYNSAGKFLFQSRHGEFFTDIDANVLQPISSQKKIAEDGKGGIAYRISHRSGVQVRNGTVELEFETWHGDVYIRER